MAKLIRRKPPKTEWTDELNYQLIEIYYVQENSLEKTAMAMNLTPTKVYTQLQKLEKIL